jgi:voltage-gated potassium channel
VARASGTRVRAWAQRLTLVRAIRTIVAVATLLVLVAGTLVRAIEPETFTSIGLAFWWAVTTITTVGYGDVVPVTTAGRLVGSLLMLTGLSLIPLLTSVVVSVLSSRRAQLHSEEQEARLARIEQRLEQLRR